MKNSLAIGTFLAMSFGLADAGWSRDLSAFAVTIDTTAKRWGIVPTEVAVDPTIAIPAAFQAVDQEMPEAIAPGTLAKPIAPTPERSSTEGGETAEISPTESPDTQSESTPLPDTSKPAPKEQAKQNDRWVFTFEPYNLTPASVSSTVQVGEIESTSSLTLGELYQGRNFAWALMGRAEAWKGNLGLMFDGRYQSLYIEQNARFARRGPEGRRVPLEAQGQIRSQVATLDLAISGHLGATAPHQRPAAEEFLPAKGVWFEPFLGGRLNYLKNDISLRLGSALPNLQVTRSESFSGSGAWLSPLVGFKAGVPLNRKLDLELYGDYSGWGVDSRDSQGYRLRGVFGYWISQRAQLQVGWEYDYLGIEAKQDLGDKNLGLITRGSAAFLGLLFRL
jgi:hypothetical protein